MGDVATQNLFALLGDEGEDPLANLSEAKPDKQEKKKPAAAPAEGRPGQNKHDSAPTRFIGRPAYQLC